MDERFYKGIEEFNAGRYSEAHEVLEDLWHEYREIDRTFIQGLIQISAGFYHFQCANWKGATSQLSKGVRKLEAYWPEHLGLEVEKLLAQIAECLKTTNELMEGKLAKTENVKIPQLAIRQTDNWQTTS